MAKLIKVGRNSRSARLKETKKNVGSIRQKFSKNIRGGMRKSNVIVVCVVKNDFDSLLQLKPKE